MKCEACREQRRAREKGARPTPDKKKTSQKFKSFPNSNCFQGKLNKEEAAAKDGAVSFSFDSLCHLTSPCSTLCVQPSGPPLHVQSTGSFSLQINFPWLLFIPKRRTGQLHYAPRHGRASHFLVRRPPRRPRLLSLAPFVKRASMRSRDKRGRVNVPTLFR